MSHDPLPPAWAEVEAILPEAYRSASETALQSHRPVIEVDDGVLRLRAGDARHEVAYAGPARARHLKVVTHLPLVVYLMAVFAKNRDHAAQRLEHLREHLQNGSRSISDLDLTDEQARRNRELVDETLATIDRLLEGADPETETLALADRCQDMVDANLADAAELNLEALHRAVSEIWSRLDQDERQSVVLLNRGNKSARMGNQVDLYFERLLGDEGARHRMVFAEGVTDQESARRVLATYLLDRRIGEAFFDDALGFRSDVLSAPTRRLLDDDRFSLPGDAD